MLRSGVTVALMLALPAAAQSPPSSREVLSSYQEKEVVAPDFSLKGLDGKTYRLSDFLGKVVVIETGSST